VSVHQNQAKHARELIEPNASVSNGSVDSVLDAAAIPRERTGGQRTAALAAPERHLYRWIMRQFGAESRPSLEATAAAAAAAGADLDQALETFRQLDLVHLADGEIAVAYPFSGRPTPHRILIDGRPEMYAMCAIDALGITAMLELPTEVLSRDPVSGGEVWVRIDPGDGAWWEPEQAVVLVGSYPAAGPSFRSCCSVLNFFESGEHALQYLLAHPEVTGHAITILEAIAAGATIFGDLLEED
jgi:Alkylmercury lyase